MLDGAGADLLHREDEDEADRGEDHRHQADAEDGGVHGEAILERLGHDTRYGVGQVVVLEEGRGSRVEWSWFMVRGEGNKW